MRENRNQWRDTIPDQLKPIGNTETKLDLKKMFTNRQVILGFIVAIVGIVIAFISFSVDQGSICTVMGFFGTACTFTGTAQITKYINDITVAAQKERK